MITIYIDNKPYQADAEGKNLLHVCLSLGFNIPYFCWHPAMHSVGACRQCAIKLFKDENDKRGKIVMSCMTPATNGIRISIDDPEAVNFRAKVTEWLMTNHPHDCPVCDEGGECHLQDMTVMTGHVYRRYRFKKRTYRNQNLGPFLNHEMNRCIQCYRCVRFYRDYAGGRDFQVMGWHNHVYYGRHENGTLENEFSGNLVEVCPTGVFTDKTFKQHYTRKWDLQTAPSICVHCGLGCNTIPGERYELLRRIRARYNDKVNGYFLCDRGRYGYEFVNSDRRIRQPQIHQKDVTTEAALEHVGNLIRNGNAIGIGSPRASLETNFALQSLVGEKRFYHGLPESELQLVRLIVDILRKGTARTPSMREVESADAILVLGEDLINTAPMLALAVRQATRRTLKDLAAKLRIQEWDDLARQTIIQDRKNPLFIATPLPTKLDAQAAATFRATPEDIARLGFAIAHEIDPAGPILPGLSDQMTDLAKRIAEALINAKNPLIISGTSCGSEEVIQASANVAWSLKKTGRNGDLSFTVPECNTLGVSLIPGEGIDRAVKAVQDETVDTLIIAENDLYRRMNRTTADLLFKKVRHIVVIDHLMNATTAQAEVVLPAATFAEADGTLVNNEGRGQRFFQVFSPRPPVQESWRWLGKMKAAAGQCPTDPWPGLDQILSEIARELPVFTQIAKIAPPESFRMVVQKIPRQPHRYSGRTAINAKISVHEPKPPKDADAPLSFSMEGFQGQPPSSLISRIWSPGWNSPQAINKFQIEVNGPLHDAEPGIRFLEPAQEGSISYFEKIPGIFVPRKGQYLVLPAYHIFGSEELSALSTGIAAMTPRPYLVLASRDAEYLNKQAGQMVNLVLENEEYILPLQIDPTLPRGLAFLSAGLPGLERILLPAWGKIALAEKGNEESQVRP